MDINLWAILLLIEWWQGCGIGWHRRGYKITSWIFFVDIWDGRAANVNFFLLVLLNLLIFCQRILIAKLFESKLILSLPFCSSVLIPWRDNWRRFVKVRIERFLIKLSKETPKITHQVLTWVSDKFSWLATSPRSATDKYFWQRNFLSRKASCEWVKAVRRRRLRFKAPLLPIKDGKRCCDSCWGWCMFE